ncbi:ice-structuring glycoprotein, partial [Cyclospora cayetanensis]|uniref:Ice-structuring glycoprotein n=1 Tax=Cyclospora cayetanensis TaxID=88456 RepID=A0A6P6S1U8_9EIME
AATPAAAAAAAAAAVAVVTASTVEVLLKRIDPSAVVTPECLEAVVAMADAYTEQIGRLLAQFARRWGATTVTHRDARAFIERLSGSPGWQSMAVTAAAAAPQRGVLAAARQQRQMLLGRIREAERAAGEASGESGVKGRREAVPSFTQEAVERAAATPAVLSRGSAAVDSGASTVRGSAHSAVQTPQHRPRVRFSQDAPNTAGAAAQIGATAAAAAAAAAAATAAPSNAASPGAMLQRVFRTPEGPPSDFTAAAGGMGMPPPARLSRQFAVDITPSKESPPLRQEPPLGVMRTSAAALQWGGWLGGEKALTKPPNSPSGVR